MKARSWGGRVAALSVATLSATGWATPVAARVVSQSPIPVESGGLPGFAPGLPDVDSRGLSLAPAAAARRALRSLPTKVSISWNQFGTPRTLVPATVEGWLATGYTGDAVAQARAFLRDQASLVGLTVPQVGDLELVNDARLGDTGHAVLFRQRVDGLGVAHDGLVAIGVRDGRIASLTSSLVPTRNAARFGAVNTLVPKLRPAEAFVRAAQDVGIRVGVKDTALMDGRPWPADFVALRVKGLAQPGLVRLRALPTSKGFRLAYETDVQHSADGVALAYVSFVDAINGDVLLRQSVVQQDVAGDVDFFTRGTPRPGGVIQASYAADKCGPNAPLVVPPGTGRITLQSNALNPLNDLVVVVNRNGHEMFRRDLLIANELTSAAVDPPATARDRFSVLYCPFADSDVPQLGVGPFEVVGAYVTASATTGPYTPVAVPAKWRYFEADAPQANGPSRDTRVTGCWDGQRTNPAVNRPVNDCARELANPSSRLVWDLLPGTNTPSFTTFGNNAATAQGWVSPAVPGEQYRPLSATRDYRFPFTNQWHDERCNPKVFASPQRNDVDAVVTNLFVGHNRMHDFSYRLGFTETNYNMQASNFGETAPQVQNDPEAGNVQAGAVSGSVFGHGYGRDNANQATFQDGVPGVTNQYLFQPITGFWAPCNDGDLDLSVYGHEYTHGTSNRMIAGPDTGLGGESTQPGAMGESWSDLVAAEYLSSTGVAAAAGIDPFANGGIAWNNAARGIRDYNLAKTPLVYGDVGFDLTGPEVHADGEIWNSVLMHVRQALIDAWNRKGINAGNAPLQLSCALGPNGATPAAPSSGFEGCPGNRRWVQYIFDAWLLQASGEPTFVDMKNAMLAADKVRTGGVDQAVMATAFAYRGLGLHSSSPTNGDDEKPDFTSPVGATNSTVTFKVVDSTTRKLVASKIWVGRYSARATPYLTTAADAAGSAVFTAGDYEFVVRAPGYGISRATATVAAGKAKVVTIKVDANFAAVSRGATITGDGERLRSMIDEDEGTTGGFNGLVSGDPIRVPDPFGIGIGVTVDDPRGVRGTAIKGKAWTVKLAGGQQLVKRLNVSTLHQPIGLDIPDDGFQRRAVALRAFDVFASTDGGRTYSKVFASAADAFPAGAPRPVAPDLAIRSFVMPKPFRADHIKVVVRTNQCTGAPAYQGDQDDDPRNNADCPLSANAYRVFVSEIEVFGATNATATPRTAT